MNSYGCTHMELAMPWMFFFNAFKLVWNHIMFLQQKVESYEIPKGTSDIYSVPDENVRHYLFMLIAGTG